MGDLGTTKNKGSQADNWVHGGEQERREWKERARPGRKSWRTEKEMKEVGKTWKEIMKNREGDERSGQNLEGNHEEQRCLLVGCLMSQQHASVSQGRICSDNFTCCHTEIEVADQTFYLTQSKYTDTRPTSPRADPITPGAWQGSHWSANFSVTGMTRPRKNPGASGIRTRDLPLSRRTP